MKLDEATDDWQLWHENMGWTQITVSCHNTEGIRASEGILTKLGLEAQESLKHGVLPSGGGNWNIRLL